MKKYFPNVNRSFSSIYQECASLCSGRIRRAFPHPTSSTQYNAHCQDATGLWILVDSLNISGCINWIWNHSGMMNRFSEQSETNIFSDEIIGNCKTSHGNRELSTAIVFRSQKRVAGITDQFQSINWGFVNVHFS